MRKILVLATMLVTLAGCTQQASIGSLPAGPPPAVQLAPAPTMEPPTTTPPPAPPATTDTPPPPPAGPPTMDLSPITAIGDQSAIDRGNLTTWMTSPTCLLAGHDTMGWAFLANIATGTIVHVLTGPCAGRYRVVTHVWQQVRGGAIPGWMSSYALVLQSCTGNVGTGFSAAVRA